MVAEIAQILKMSLLEKYTTENVENVECLSNFQYACNHVYKLLQWYSLSIGILYNELYKYKNTAIPVLTLRWEGGGMSIGEENHWHRVQLC